MGTTYLETQIDNRHLDLECYIFSKDQKDLYEKRLQISQVFNYTGMGRLEYTNDHLTVFANVVVSGGPVWGPTSSNTQPFMVYLQASNPFWTSGVLESEPVFTPLFTWPINGVFQMGLQQEKRTLVNAGDVPTPLIIEFHGPATNPVMTKTKTGEFIKVNRTLSEGEILTVNTEFGNISVTITDGTVETNAFNWIDLNSTFFQLDMGDNEIAYTADSSVAGAVVDMYFENYYTGV